MALLLPNVLKPPVRTVTYYSSRKGKRKTVKAVIYRFLRLHSGLWLRRKVSLHTVTCLEEECEVRWDWSKIQLACSLIHLPHILAVAFTALHLSPSFVGISSYKRIHVKKTCFSIQYNKILLTMAEVGTAEQVHLRSLTYLAYLKITRIPLRLLMCSIL